VCFKLKSKAVTAEFTLKPGRAVDEKERLLEVVFLLQLSKKHLRQHDRSASRETDMEDVVRLGIDRCIQPELLVIDLDHGFVERSVIRRSAVDRL